MKKILLIAVILISLLLSCGIFASGGIFDPEDINRVYDIVEVHNMPMQDWIEYTTAHSQDFFDWPEKIELRNFRRGQKIEGRVKMHHFGWFPIIDLEIDSGNSFTIDINKDELPHVTGMGFYDNSIDNNNLEGLLSAIGPLIDPVERQFRATR